MTDGAGTLALIVVIAIVTYLGWCALYPHGRCWWWRCPRRKPRYDDGYGHYRRRRGVCPLCHNGDYRRLGARLIGAGRD